MPVALSMQAIHTHKVGKIDNIALFRDMLLDCCRYGALNVQAGTQFCDADFQKEVATGKVTSGSLDRFCCIALAGVATEYVLYGQAEGGLNDVQQLDSLLKALQARPNSPCRAQNLRFAHGSTNEAYKREHKGVICHWLETASAGA